jgi:hypothetical protein
LENVTVGGLLVESQDFVIPCHGEQAGFDIGEVFARMYCVCYPVEPKEIQTSHFQVKEQLNKVIYTWVKKKERKAAYKVIQIFMCKPLKCIIL